MSSRFSNGHLIRPRFPSQSLGNFASTESKRREANAQAAAAAQQPQARHAIAIGRSRGAGISGWLDNREQLAKSVHATRVGTRDFAREVSHHACGN